jgi:hypothetical protein
MLRVADCVAECIRLVAAKDRQQEMHSYSQLTKRRLTPFGKVSTTRNWHDSTTEAQRPENPEFQTQIANVEETSKSIVARNGRRRRICSG